MNRIISKLLYILLAIISVTNISAQERGVTISLNEVIEQAQQKSVQALMAKNTYLSKYWQFRYYKAQLSPSLWLSGKLPDFGRSLSRTQDWQSGEYNYINDYQMTNYLNLYLKQNIAATGGAISLNTSLERQDQYSPDRKINYISQPIYLRIDQPIGRFNQLKWDKRIEPVKYEQAKFEYLETMGKVSETALSYFFQQLTAEQILEMARKNHTNTKSQYNTAQERFKIGAISRNDLLQLELNMLNTDLEITNNEIQLNLARARLRTFLGYENEETLELVIPATVPGIKIPLDSAYNLSVNNTSFMYSYRVSQLEAEREVARAKAEQGLQVDLSAEFGLNQYGSKIGDTYKRPTDQERVSLSLAIPILDGGMRRGKVKTALSKQEVTDAALKNDLIDRREDIFVTVLQFNNQNNQCKISYKADSIAQERYELANRQFAIGNLTVLELNAAQTDKDNARQQYVNSLKDYWDYYYKIQRITLYDFITGQNISEVFDRTDLEK